MHRVFSSSYNYTAYSQQTQFHRNNVGDNETVVTSFMHVITYMTRYFATLQPSELQLPFDRF